MKVGGTMYSCWPLHLISYQYRIHHNGRLGNVRRTVDWDICSSWTRIYYCRHVVSCSPLSSANAGMVCLAADIDIETLGR